MAKCTELSHGDPNHPIKRFNQGAGTCDWCGQTKRTTFDYRSSGALDYRLNRPTRQFCNLECYRQFWQ
jgi:hypothetical protein